MEGGVSYTVCWVSLCKDGSWHGLGWCRSPPDTVRGAFSFPRLWLTLGPG